MATYYGNASYYELCNGSNGACAGFGYPCDIIKTTSHGLDYRRQAVIVTVPLSLTESAESLCT